MTEIDELAWEQAAAEHGRADDLVVSGDIEAAEPVALAAAEALRRAVGAEHPDYANALATVALVAEKLGRLREGIELGRRALAILDLYRDERVVDPLRRAASVQLAFRLAIAGHYAEAEQLSREALALSIDEHPFEAQAWVSLGVSVRLAGRHDEAEAAYGRAAALYRGAGDPIPPDLRHNLAGLAYARGDHGAAEVHAREAIAARAGAEHDDTFELGQDLCGLGDALMGQGRSVEAEQAYREGLACYERVGRSEHVEVAFALHNLGDALAEQGRFDEAQACYRRSIALKQVLLGAEHHELAATLTNLAVLYADNGRLADARSLSARAVEIVQALDERHPVRSGVESCACSLSR